MAEEQKERGLVVYHAKDGQEIRLSYDTVRRFLVSGKPEFVTDQEIVLYMGTCKARGLNPFKRDCYLVKYTQNDPAATIVSIDYFRSRAKAQPDCVGWQCGVIALSKDGKVEYRKGSFMFDGDELLGGWFRARPKGWTEDYEWSVNLKPFIKKRNDGQTTQFWHEEKQPQQIAKVAESQGLRRIWPDEFQSLYVEDEIMEARDVTPEQEPIKKPQAVAKADDVPKSDTDSPRDVPAGAKKTGKVSDPAEALHWIASANDDEIFEKEALAPLLKGLSQADQLTVCKSFNARKQSITDDLATDNANA